MDLREPLGGGQPAPEGGPSAEEAEKSTHLVKALVGRSRAFRLVYEQIERAAGSDVPVLITGETGTGKALVAQAIHELSTRKQGPFVHVPIGDVEAGRVEAEIFGAKAGAFEGLTQDVPGKIEQANGGTIYLEEVSSLDDGAQEALLRYLETREVKRVGDDTAKRVDVRVIASSTHDLRSQVDGGEIREDLFFRLSVFSIQVPPLRERKEDIPRLVRRFLQELAAERNTENARSMSPAALEVLKRYRWPGNIRELRSAVRQAAENAGNARVLEPDHLPEHVRRATPSLEAVTIPIGTTLEEAERTIIQRTVEATGGNKKEAAQVLGISRSALYAKLKRLDIEL
jgi:DNA-binding NtrC family response regulator